MTTFSNFHWGAQNAWKYRKTGFYVFCLFTPLYRRFRLSRAYQSIDLDEIYRLVSKILNFMPCGSVFDRFCVEKRSKWLKISWKSMKIYWKSVENLMKIYRTSNENLMKIYWTSIGNLLKIYRIFIEYLSKVYRKTAQYRAGRHEITNFWYEAIELFTLYRCDRTREPETPI